MKRKQNGIALVITLVMLAIVTVMAIVFLAVTRRERSSVKVTEETAIAKDMADAALERVKTEVMSDMNANGSKLHYDIFSSQAFYNKGPNVAFDNPLGGNGFTPGNASATNVAHVSFWPNIRNGSQANYLRMLANLQYDPAVPVFVETNRNGASDFRHYLDFNRNRQFELSFVGWGWDVNTNTFLTNTLGTYVGDPEWFGMLERPDFPHSETNRFVGRMAYLVLPAGKTLDLNFIHNQVNPSDRLDLASSQNGFSRSQGVGSWEINLAAFLRELNGNPYAWYPNSYRLNLLGGTFDARGEAFNNARELLAFRFKQRRELKPYWETLGFYNLYNPQPQNAFGYVSGNLVDDFGDRPLLPPRVNSVFFRPTEIPIDNDSQTTDGWPGSINTNAWTDLQQLFSVENSSVDFVNRLRIPGLRAADGGSGNSGLSSYDRYTFYRLAAQLGTDSTPATEGKIHLNFKNPVGLITNVTERWLDNPTNASMFFTNAADLMLKANMEGRIVISNRTQELRYGRPVLPGQTQTAYRVLGDTLVREDFSLTNIQVYGTNPRFPGVIFNEYTPTVHRILQVAANIFDSMTNRIVAANAAPMPSVFMPVFEKTATNIVITRFVELGGDTDQFPARSQLSTTRLWIDPESAFTNALPRPLSQYNLYGQHIIIGAKKGHPNFNELALNSQVTFSRKLAFIKDNAFTTNIVATNQMFLVDLKQRWGMEAWNSYRSAYNRALTVTGEVTSFVALRDGPGLLDSPVYQTNYTIGKNITTTNPWPARGLDKVLPDRNFLLPLDQTTPLMVERSYNPAILPKGPARFSNNNDANFTAQLNMPPEFILWTTNRVKFWAIDNVTGRLIDFASFDRIVTRMDLREQLRQNDSVAGGTNQSVNQYWVTNRIGGSPYLTEGVQDQIDVSLGNLDEPQWNSYRYTLNNPDKGASISKFRQFVGAPLRTGIDTNLNEPPHIAGVRMQVPFTPTREMIQRMTWQVNDPLVHYMVEDLRRDRDSERPEFFDGAGPNINAPDQWNINQRNEWYHPWGGPEEDDPNQDRFAWNYGLMDPGVRSSDDWDFLPRHTNFTHFASVGALGQVHRGTPWQTLYLKSAYIVDPVGRTNRFVAHPSLWYDWAGSIGTYPSQDWRLLDVFTTAANENAARGLLSVNQTNIAAWSAVLSGVIAATNHIDRDTAFNLRNKGTVQADSYSPRIIEPSTAQIADIVASINAARTNQFDIIRHPNPSANTNLPYIGIWRTNSLVGRRMDVFRHMGEILHAPALTTQSPFLNPDLNQLRAVWTDRAVEFIPQQILSLLQRDEPRFVVYAFGQSLKPAPRSLTTDPNFYHMCTNYQITGEVVTKTTFRVEGEPMNAQNPLRPVVEKYEILPPVE